MSGKDLQPMASIRRSRRPLLSSCALASALAVLGHAPAAAQSFQGTVLGTPTNATVNNSVPGQTTVTVTAPTAIVNWQPTDTAAGSAPITFQGAGTTATFSRTGGDFTVLNRIVPTGAASGRSVLLNGTINSFIDSGAAGPQQGGAVWFYSPGGLVIGSQASIDVGGLLLTTRDLTDAEFLTSSGTYNFGAADSSRSSVTIQAGAQIDAASVTGNSYVAVVAPRIVQAGTVRVDGSAAYVAAEQATITMGGGLFDIQVQSGSAVDTGTPGDEVTLSHTGSTTGPALSSSGNPQAIYMVAIPKNVAIAMLVGGNVGYDVNASVEDNGTVVLSAGSNVDSSGFLTGGPASGVGANLTITGNSSFTSATRASARTDALAQTGAGGSLTFDKGFLLSGGRSATLAIGDNGTVDVGRDLTVATTNRNDADAAIRGTAAITLGGNAALTAIGGDVRVDASAFELGDATGGFASVTAGAGSALELQSLAILAEAGSSQSTATGGDATLSLTGASLDTQSLLVSAFGRGGDDLDGGAGTGGNVRMTLTDASLYSENQISLDARGQGGGGGNGGANGPGSGGLAQLTVAGATASLETDGDILITAAGSGGFDATDGTGDGIGGGAGSGGIASFTHSGANLRTGQLTVDASGTGTDALSSNLAGINGGDGGSGTGGTATASITAQTLDIGGVGVRAEGIGGGGGSGFEIFEFGYGTGTSPDGGDGGDALGGTAELTVGGNLNAGQIVVDASATAGFSGSSDFGQRGDGANAGGGEATFNLLANASATPGSLTVTAAASGSDGGTGGNGTGGDVILDIADGASLLLTDSYSITAEGAGGGGNASGGDGAGGSVAVTIGAGGNFSSGSSSLQLSARGVGGTGDNIGGSATGGSVALASIGGSISTFELTLDASAQGGLSSGAGGDATGGTATFSLDGAALSIDNLILDAGAYVNSPSASAQGGDAGLTVSNGGELSVNRGVELRASGIATDGTPFGTGQGGNGTGGSATLRVDGGSLSAGFITLDARGQGGNSTLFAPGGDGTGGTIVIDIAGRAGEPATVDSGSLTAEADGTGGSALIDSNSNTSGRDGGAGTGGTIMMTVGGALTLAGGEGGSELYLSAGGQGGDAFAGGTGGSGTGGTITLATVASPGGAGSIAVDSISLLADGTGGEALDPGIVAELPALDPTASSGGSGSGGVVTLGTTGGDIDAGEVTASAIGTGQQGASALTEFPGGAGGNGGAGAGATFTLNLGGGDLAAPLSVTVNAVAGSGGNGSAGGNGGAGGDATGGGFAINLTGAATSLDLPGGFALDLSALAGNGGDAGDTASGPGANGGDGGNATGGSLSLATAGTGGSLSLGSLSFDGSATGGNGGRSGAGTTAGTAGDGGSGTGGSLTLAAGPGTLTIGDTDATLDGRGGDGGTGGGGDGGAGTGGAFNAQATGGTIQLGALTVASNGTGGIGSSGIGGAGTGGQVRLATADSPGGVAGQITALATSLTANGVAGSGTVVSTASAGGIAISQTSATAAGLIRFASLDTTAQGAGGVGVALVASGGTIAVTGGATVASGGPVRLSGVNGGAVTVGDDLVATAGAGATLGNLSANSILLTATGDVVFEGDVTGTDRLTAQSTGGSILVNGAATLTGGTGPGGLLQLLSPNGINAPDATLVAGGTAQFYLGTGDFVVDSLTVGNRIDTIDASFGFTNFNQLVSVGAIRIGGTTTVTDGSLDLSAGTDLALGEVVASDDIRLSAPGAVSANSLTAGDDITVDGGSIAIGTATTTGLGSDNETGYGGDGLGNIYLTAANGIVVAGIDAFGAVSAGDGDGGITIDTLLAGGNVLLSSSDGAVLVATDLVAGGIIDAFGTDVTLRAIGGLTISSITATTGDILIETGGAVDVGNASAGGSLTLDAGSDARLAYASAGDAINVTARGLATLVEFIDALSINVASYDIAILDGEGPALIGLDADSITLSNIGTGRSRVGGGDVSGTWSLSNAEFGRLSAHDITIAATGAGEGASMTIGQLDVIGSAGEDSGSRRRNLTGSDLTLRADGSILTNGAVSLTGAGAEDRLMLGANDRITVDTTTGAISLTGQGSALGGTLVMDAPTIFVGTAQAWTDISALSSLDAKSDRLGRNDGVSNPEGFLRADAMEFRAAQGLYIQNSGTDTRPTAERAGFTVGSGGVTIVTLPNEGPPLEIAINGRQARADGTFATGADLIPLLRLQGAGSASMASFNPRSTANGCLIVGLSCTADGPTDTGIPQQDIIHALDPDPDFDGETGLVPPLTPPIIQFAERIGLSSGPVIEEPVTGTANENLWLGSDAGGPAIDQQVTGTRNDDDDQATPGGQPIGEQVTGTRNDSLDEQVTGTRNEDRDEAEKPNR